MNRCDEYKSDVVEQTETIAFLFLPYELQLLYDGVAVL